MAPHCSRSPIDVEGSRSTCTRLREDHFCWCQARGHAPNLQLEKFDMPGFQRPGEHPRICHGHAESRQHVTARGKSTWRVTMGPHITWNCSFSPASCGSHFCLCICSRRQKTQAPDERISFPGLSDEHRPKSIKVSFIPILRPTPGASSSTVLLVIALFHGMHVAPPGVAATVPSCTQWMVLAICGPTVLMHPRARFSVQPTWLMFREPP